MSQLALLATLILIAWLFYLEWDRKAKVSGAVWLPVIWLSIAASRPVSMWFGADAMAASEVAEGNPFERNIYICLIAAGLFVLVTRIPAVLKIVKANGPLLAYVIFALISITWSDFAGVALKRWIKFLGDFVMILIILTERDPLTALKRLLARPGFILMPLSVYLIRYSSDLGRYYSRWEGLVCYRGVSSDKNMLGMACLILGLGASWRVLEEWKGARQNKILVAHGVVMLMAVYLLRISDSMTSLATFVMGSALMFATAYLKIGRKPWFVRIMVPAFLTGAFFFVFFGGPLLTAIGRDPTLTGRTVLWDFVLKLNPNSVLGAGFESFWLGERLEKIWRANWWRPNQAHNGYIETYLNLGWLGLGLVITIIISGYTKIVKMLSHDPEAARIRLAFFVVAVVYNYTEAAIKMMHPVWFAFLLATIVLPDWSSAKAKVINMRARNGTRKVVGPRRFVIVGPRHAVR